ncbi:MAG: glycoside hydrolase family 3 C-terminal domain-containing protein [Lachnospiraceae bacterium]|nr:glycoside hydrolase family 3 C-terminal domain-containing protein [Lachnospiraceae bacterium]
MEIKFYQNNNGPMIGVGKCGVIEKDGYYFRDLEGTGELLPYEDWRLDVDERTKDLVSRMSVREMAGLMMYSPHQMVPGRSFGPFHFTYGGKSFEESGKMPYELSDQQKQFLEEDGIRHVLLMRFENVETVVAWNNEMQAMAESLPHGIPIAFSSDPRHGAGESMAEFKSQAKDVSKWPEGLGMASTFDANLCKRFAQTVAKEYRALGITVALHPQIDLGTEPRWMRLEDTFGSHPELVTEFGKAFCDGIQTTENSETGWGAQSVCAMAKHWPGGGTGEAGRDAHYSFGKYAVYPGENFEEHLKPFLEGAFQLEGKTKKAGAIMPYYTVSWGIDTVNNQNVGNSYSKYIINDLLREKYGYDGIVCTDWGITADQCPEVNDFGSRCYGVEDLSEAERHLRIIENSVDQFGGNSDIRPILEAYELGCEKHGEAWMRERMEQSARRLLKNIFLCGLFENPYLEIEESKKIVGCKEHVEAGFDAQLQSVVMLKNEGVLPISERKKVYVPKRYIKEKTNFFRMMDVAMELPGARRGAVEAYYDWVDTPEEADFALIFIESPLTDAYSVKDREEGGNGYLPISLQYRPYTALKARAESIAGGDYREASANRSYCGKTNYTANENDLDIIIETKKRMTEKPVIVVIRMHNPAVLSELEPYADAILVDFGVSQEAICELVKGNAEPKGLLPVSLPADMDTVEAHAEDVPFDYEVYVDSVGHAYQFAYGLNWNGVIEDDRTKKYGIKK